MSLQAHAKKDYVGSQKCFSCHEDQYNDFVVSGHPYKLTKAKIAKNRPLPLPKGSMLEEFIVLVRRNK